jgi:methylthioribulose 1-phosphate dehydratase / enolase-phosphatase E1
LRSHITCYFDTTVGHKRQAASYSEILQSLGVTDAPEDAARVLFVTDVLEEAQAAHQAGMHAIISIREGNAPLPEGHGFRTVDDFHAF